MIFQSHWSKPTRWLSQNNSIADMLFMYAASAHSVKKAFGQPVAMVTDSSFASILSDLPMPYDHITTELDGLRIDPRWWAAPKFHIFGKYSAQFPWLLQLDTDVFFWEPMRIGTHVDLLTQSIEHGEQFATSYAEPVRFFDRKFREMGIPPNRLYPWRPDLQTALNCGVVGFRNPAAAMEYAAMATGICDLMTPHLDEFEKNIPAKKRMGSAMVIPEQYFLKCYAAARDLQIAYVSTKLERGRPSHYDPDDYYHAMGSKEDPSVRAKFRQLVMRDQPELHRAIMASAYAGF